MSNYIYPGHSDFVNTATFANQRANKFRRLPDIPCRQFSIRVRGSGSIVHVLIAHVDHIDFGTQNPPEGDLKSNSTGRYFSMHRSDERADMLTIHASNVNEYAIRLSAGGASVTAESVDIHIDVPYTV